MSEGFTAVETCAKCGHSAPPAVTWVPPTTTGEYLDPEHLHVACARCGYGREEAPLDQREPAPQAMRPVEFGPAYVSADGIWFTR